MSTSLEIRELVTCEVCGRLIADVEKCPQCGVPRELKTPRNEPARSDVGPLVFGGFVLLIVTVVAATWFFGDSASGPAAPATTQGDDAAEGRTAIALAVRAVPTHLKDPDSAAFRNLTAHKAAAGGVMVCGEINAKNSFGGYTGFSKFIWSPSVTVLQEGIDPNEFAKVWNETCARARVLAQRP